MPLHLETYDDWLNWDEEKDPLITLSSKLLLTLKENRLIDNLDFVQLAPYVVDKADS